MGIKTIDFFIIATMVPDPGTPQTLSYRTRVLASPVG
jgi:hypothetical protein